MGRKIAAYTGPFLVFMLFIGLSGLLENGRPATHGVGAIYLVYPLQTIVCAGLLAGFWREYGLKAPRKLCMAIGIGVLVFAMWISPQALFHVPRRLDGFNPEIFRDRAGLYWTELALRFVRLALVVPLLEEIFWRGFLLRYLVSENFDAIPFGSYTARENILVAVAFMLEHQPHDYPAAIAAGFLYNLVAYRTKSLSSCVVAHGLTNLLLGGYIMITHQWGFW